MANKTELEIIEFEISQTEDNLLECTERLEIVQLQGYLICMLYDKIKILESLKTS